MCPGQWPKGHSGSGSVSCWTNCVSDPIATLEWRWQLNSHLNLSGVDRRFQTCLLLLIRLRARHPSSLFTERIKMCKGRTHSKGRDSRADEYNNYEFVYTGKVILLYWKQNLTNLTTGPYVRREVGNFPELWWCSCLSQNHVEALGRWRELAVWGLLAIRIACVTNYPKTPLDNHFILLVILWFVNLGRIVLGHSCSVL